MNLGERDDASRRRRAEALAEATAAGEDASVGPLTAEEAARLRHELRVARIEADLLRQEHAADHAEVSASWERYYDLYDQAPVGYCTLTADAVVLEANLAASEILGVRRGALVMQPLRRFVDPADQSLFERFCDRVTLRGEQESQNVRMVRSDGQGIVAQVVAAPMAPAGDSRAVRLVMQDVTDRILSGRALAESEARFRGFFDHAHSAIVLHRAVLNNRGEIIDFIHLDANAAYEQVAGLRVPQVVGKGLRETVPPDICDGLISRLARVTLTGQPDSFDLHVPGLEKHLRFVVYRTSQAHCAAIFDDVTERVRAHEALVASEARYRGLFENTLNGVGIFDPVSNQSNEITDFLLIDANSAFEQQSRIPLSAANGHSILEMAPDVAGTDLIRRLAVVSASGQSAVFDLHAGSPQRHYHLSVLSMGGGRIAILFDNITEVVRTQRSLDASETRYRRLLENSLNAVSIQRAVRDARDQVTDFEVIGANPAFERMSGIGPDEATGRLLSTLPYAPSSAALVACQIEALRTGEASELQVDLNEIGKHFLTQVYCTGPDECAVLAMEISGQVRAVRALRAANDELNLTLEAANAGTFVWEAATGVTKWSRHLASLMGLDISPNDVTFQSWIDSIHPEDRERVQCEVQQAMAACAAATLEWRPANASGPARRFMSRATPVFDAAGVLARFVGVVTDISDSHARDSAKQFLAEAAMAGPGQPFFDALVRFLAGCLEADLVSVSRIAPDGGTARTVAIWLDGAPQDLDGEAPLFSRLPCTGVPRQRTCSFPSCVCQSYPCESALTALGGAASFGVEMRGAGGSAVGRITVVWRRPLADSSAARSLLETLAPRAAVELLLMDAAARLQASEAALRAFFEYAVNGLVLHDAVRDESGEIVDFRVTDANPAYERHVGVAAADVVGRTLRDVAPGVEQLGLIDAMIRVTTTGAAEIPVIRLPVGDRHFRVSLFRTGSDRCAAVYSDITEVVLAAEERLRAADRRHQIRRMEAMARLTGGLAQDFERNLAIIEGRAAAAEAPVRAVGGDASALTEIRVAAERSLGLARRLRTFAGERGEAPASIDINDALGRTLELPPRPGSGAIPAGWRPGEGLPPVAADASTVDQMIRQALAWAARAAPRGSRITVSTDGVMADTAFCAAHPSVRPGLYVCVTVSAGLPADGYREAELLDALTIRAPRAAALPPLPIEAAAVAQRCRGFATLERGASVGAAVHLHLPAAVADGSGDGAENAAPEEGGTVLLVDQDMAALEILRAALEAVGCTVIPAGSAGEALHAVSDHPATIDLLLADYALPNMSGAQLAEALRLRRPGLKALFMADPGAGSVGDEAGGESIARPFTAAELAARVRDLLVSRDGG